MYIPPLLFPSLFSSPFLVLTKPIQSKTDHSTQPTKSEKIDRVKANLPLPDDPPVASDWNSADGRTVNVGSGRVQDEVSEMAKGGESGLRGPATAESSVRVDGGEWKKATAP
jgi:hypothetical protein